MAVVQLLTFAGCPNAAPARDVLQRALAGTGLAIVEVDIARPDASEAERRWGSPTILVDGVDVASGAREPAGGALCCRLAPITVDQIRGRLRA